MHPRSASSRPRPASAASPRRQAHGWWGRLVGAVLVLVVVTSVAAEAAPPDPYAPYQPQTNCSPHAKPGTVRLSAWLQRQYPGSGSMGISRSCHDGGVSEHKEGRAFDWAVNVHSARDRGYVGSFLHRILATDAEGDKHALARRMGIMYLIWDDHIYASYSGFAKRPYHGCRVAKGCSDTLRHRNHVHLSLSRAGGAGRTTWYTGATGGPEPAGGTPKPSPEPAPPPSSEPAARPVLDLTRRPFARVRVPADGRTVATWFRLERGHSYRLTVAGVYGYGDPAQVADASCRWSVVDRSWTPYPSRAVAAAHGSLNLLVDGAPVSAAGCHPGSHVYARTLTPTRTRALRLRVANPPTTRWAALTVLVSRRGADVRGGLPRLPTLAAAPTRTAARPGPGLLAETVRVPAGAGTVRSVGGVERGASYRVTVTGTVGLGAGARSDGRCVSLDGHWYPQAALDRRDPGAAHTRLFVDGVPFAGDAASGATCASRTHVLERTATRSGRLELAIWDPLSRRDDTGALSVRVQRLTALPTPVAAAAERAAGTAPWRRARDTVVVEASSDAGAVSVLRLRAGQRVDLMVRGTTRSGSRHADASCVHTRTGWAMVDRTLALRQDPHQLWVNGRPGRWRPVRGRAGCSPTHVYRTRYVAPRSGPLRLAILDLDHRSATGSLTVSLTRRR